MSKVFFYIIGLLIFGTILLSGCTQTPETIPAKGDLGIYDATDSSINNFLSPENQTQNFYDAVDASVEQFLNK